MMKRVFDIIAAFLGLVVCSPLFIVVALLIKLDSPGPVFFKQPRQGKGFRPFSMYKFRTMVQNAPQMGGLLTVRGDPRITRLGKFLRQYKLDELPQLINVLKGEMSLVGPRPQTLEKIEMFKEKYKEILTIRPGLTDLATLKYIDEAALLEKLERPEDQYAEKVLPEKTNLIRVIC